MIVEADNSFDSTDAQPPNLVGHYAGFASRAIALIIDYLIILLLLYINVWFINSIPDMFNVQSLNLSWLNSLVILISSTIFTIAFIYGYFSIFWFLTGQTLGNAVIGIRVIKTNGRRIGFLRLAVGPVPMMKAVSELTRDKNISTYVSLNAIMVDGTGMCGACRVTVGGETNFACFHGPDFDWHKVDFENLMKRQKMFVKEEKAAFACMNS